MKPTSDATGLIFDIQKFSIHDGPGIRTLVFMKGCPLSCGWCCNPESQKAFRQIAFIETNCIRCGQCVDACPAGAVVPDTFHIKRDVCDNCGKCADVCPAGAKRLIGSSISIDTLLEEVDKDRIFYRNSRGGVTISGGEPTLQHTFVSGFLQAAQALNIDTAVETCGFAQWENLKSVVEHARLVYLDIKHMDPGMHQQYTGVDNALILKNAARIGSLTSMIIRIPVIPGFNDSKKNIAETAGFVRTLQNVKRLELLPYHPLGEYKYPWLGKTCPMAPPSPPSDAHIRELTEIVRSYGIETAVVSM